MSTGINIKIGGKNGNTVIRDQAGDMVGGMSSSNYVIKREIRRRWWGKKYITYVLYDSNGKEIISDADIEKVKTVKKLLRSIDCSHE